MKSDYGAARRVAFWKKLFLSGAALSAAIASGGSVHAQVYTNYNGDKTSDYNAAVASWSGAFGSTTDWGLAGINAQYAYALGYSTTGVKLGAVDPGASQSQEEFSAAYDAVAEAERNSAFDRVRAIGSNWGSPTSAGNEDTLTDLLVAYARVNGVEKAGLDAVTGVAPKHDVLMVWPTGDGKAANGNTTSMLPYSRPDIEKYWIAVASRTQTGEIASKSVRRRQVLVHHFSRDG